MKSSGSALLDWLDHRTGFRAIRKHLLDEPLPAGTGWWFTLGSVLLFGLGVQVVTGIALALYYAPTPDHAWDSVRYITTDVRGGRLLRGLHHYGASVVVVAALAHLVRVVFFGSYRKPREMNWIVGLLLLQVILAFGLTGYLLPWDQRAYWATVVTINISKLTPGLGEAIAAVLRGGSEIGALTLTRWYAAHVLVLPPVSAGLDGHASLPDAPARHLGSGAPEVRTVADVLSVPGLARSDDGRDRRRRADGAGVERGPGARAAGRPDLERLHPAAGAGTSSASSSSSNIFPAGWRSSARWSSPASS